MITVGIRNLRNSLSKYIELAKNGETILITDHNKIVAEKGKNTRSYLKIVFCHFLLSTILKYYCKQ